MAVYTHFGGMPGLWRAVRQEGFTRLAAALADQAPRGPRPGGRPDAWLLGSVYAANALAAPALYRAMFDAGASSPTPMPRTRRSTCWPRR